MRNLRVLLFSYFMAKSVLAANTITVQGVLRDSAGDLVSDYTPTGGIKAVFYHATHCTAVVNGDTDLLGCAPSGAAGSEVIDPFQIKAGAFSVSIEAAAGTLANMASAPTGWFIKIRGVFASGAPVGEFLIPLDSVPFAKTAEVSAAVNASATAGNSVIAAINATASSDAKINANRLTIDGSDITSGTIGGSASISTTGTLDSGAVTSTGLVTGVSLLVSGLGTATTPAFRFSGDPNTGIYSSGADTLDFATGGTNRMSLSSTGALTLTGAITNSVAGAASLPAFSLRGAWFTGGSTTTTKPHLLIEPTGATSTAWSSSGTGLGVNAASGFVGNLVDLQTNGSSRFRVDQNGNVYGQGAIFIGSTTVVHPSYGFAGTGFHLNDPSWRGASRVLSLGSTSGIAWSPNTDADNATADTFMGRDGAATLRLGDAAAASPVDQTLKAQDASGTNISGGALNLASGLGTGSASGGAINFKISAPGTSGTTAGTFATVVTASNAGLGIGATSPAEKLEVSGNAKVGAAPSSLTTVSGAHTSAATTINVASTSGYPANGTLLINYEAMTYTGVTATSFTGVTRGVMGTTAVALSNGQTVDSFALALQSTSTSPRFMVTHSGQMFIFSTGQSTLGNGASPRPKFGVDPTSTGASSATTGRMEMWAGSSAIKFFVGAGVDGIGNAQGFATRYGPLYLSSDRVSFENVASSGGPMYFRVPGSDYGNGTDFRFYGGGTEVMRLTAGGALGVGMSTLTSGYKFDLLGDARIQGGLCLISGAGVGNCDGTDGKIWASNTSVAQADLAEHMPIEDQNLSAGDVVVVGASKDGSYGVYRSTRSAYETGVLGVVSTKPGLTMGVGTPDSRPVALAGRVPVNVTLEGGEIRIGDLLVSSSTPGRAMRAKDASLGGVIGVALSNYEGEAVAPQSKNDSIAHENGHQVMMLVLTPNSFASTAPKLRVLSRENQRLSAAIKTLSRRLRTIEDQLSRSTHSRP